MPGPNDTKPSTSESLDAAPPDDASAPQRDDDASARVVSRAIPPPPGIGSALPSATLPSTAAAVDPAGPDAPAPDKAETSAVRPPQKTLAAGAVLAPPPPVTKRADSKPEHAATLTPHAAGPATTTPLEPRHSPSMPSLAVGPRVVREGETPPPVPGVEIPATGLRSRDDEPDAPPPAEPREPSERSGSPVLRPVDDALLEEVGETASKLPLPGMLRSESSSPALKDFRRPKGNAPRHTPPPPPDAGVLPSAGVAPPPGAGGEPEEIEPENTDILIASVASELIGPEPVTLQPTRPPDLQSTETPIAAIADPIHISSESLPAMRRGEERANRPWGWIAIALLAIVGVGWALSRDDAPTPATPSPSPAGAVAKAALPEDPPPPPGGEPEPGNTIALADDPAEDPSPAALETTGDGTGGSGVDPATGSSSGDPEPWGDESLGAPDPASTDAPPPRGSRPAHSSSSKKKPSSNAGDPEPTPSADTPQQSAASLLAEARRAYSAGQGAKAYALAKQSNALKPTTGALETMALASCQRKDKNTAANLLKKLPLSRRSSVRDRCRTYGVRLGL